VELHDLIESVCIKTYKAPLCMASLIHGYLLLVKDP